MYEVLNKSTYWLINSRKANNSRTHQLINLLTQKLIVKQKWIWKAIGVS